MLLPFHLRCFGKSHSIYEILGLPITFTRSTNHYKISLLWSKTYGTYS